MAELLPVINVGKICQCLHMLTILQSQTMYNETCRMIFGKNHTTNNFILNKKKQETEIHSANTKQRIGPQ